MSKPRPLGGGSGPDSRLALLKLQLWGPAGVSLTEQGIGRIGYIGLFLFEQLV